MYYKSILEIKKTVDFFKEKKKHTNALTSMCRHIKNKIRNEYNYNVVKYSLLVMHILRMGLTSLEISNFS